MKAEAFYKFPLQLDDYTKGKVWTKDNEMAFDFADDSYADGRPYAKLDLQSKKNIVDCLNDQYLMKAPHTLVREREEIFIKLGNHKLLFIVLRGWGHLTGTAGLALPDSKAAAIQDAFGDLIIRKLTNKDKREDAVLIG